MNIIKLFEEFRVKNRSGIKGSSHKGGSQEIMSRFGVDFDNDDFIHIKKKYLKKLDTSMKKIAKKFGLSDTIKYLDSGSFGMAFSCGKYVIKLTSDRREINQVNKLLGKNVPGCTKYYKIMFNPDYEIWAIMLDKVDQLTNNQVGIINDIQSFLYQENNGTNASNLLYLLECEIDEFLTFYGIEDRKDHKKYHIVEKTFNDFKDLINKLCDNNVTMDDIHSGNLGYKNDEMIAFDIMGMESK